MVGLNRMSKFAKSKNPNNQYFKMNEDKVKAEKKSINYYMRKLHRDFGFFIIGLTIIYALTGIILIFRDTNFLKSEVLIEKSLAPNMAASDLGNVLRKKDFKVLKTAGDTLYFKEGTYNRSTGAVSYTENELPSLLKRATLLHKSSTRTLLFVFPLIYAALLLFLAISAFWMFKPNTKLFKRGIIIAIAGVITAIVLLIV